MEDNPTHRNTLAIVRLTDGELSILTSITKYLKDEALHEKLRNAQIELAIHSIQRELEVS